MNIGIDSYVFKYPLSGVGTYSYLLIKNLIKYFPNENYHLYIDDNLIAKEFIKNKLPKSKIEILGKLPIYHRNRYLRKLFSLTIDKILDPDTLFQYKYSKIQNSFNLKTENNDVTHTIDWLFPPSKKAKKKIITIFDLTSSRMPFSVDTLCIGKENLKEKLCKDYDHIIAISNSTKSDLINFYKVPEEKIETIYLDVDKIYSKSSDIPFDQIRSKLNLPESNRYFLTVSTIEPRKNFLHVLESFKIFNERIGKNNFSLVCVGSWGWKNSELNSYIKNYPFKNLLYFTGHAPLEYMPSIYKHSKAFLYLSLYEGFGLPVLEAMRCRTPVIASNISSIPEIIGDEGVLINPKDKEELVHAMSTLLNNEKNTQALVNRAYIRSNKFSWEKNAKETMKLYVS